MVNCCILGCRSRSERQEPNITFHSFPVDEKVRALWARASGRSEWQPTKYMRICSRHFETDCIRKTKKATALLEGSVPKLFLPTPQKTVGEIDVSPPHELRSTSKVSGANPQMDRPSNRNVDSTSPADAKPSRTMLKKLLRKTKLAAKRKKEVAALRSKIWRLQKKNTELTIANADLQQKYAIEQELNDLLSIISPCDMDDGD